MNQINQIQQEKFETPKGQQQQQQIVNGVNVSKLFGTVEAIKGNHEIAKFNFKARGKWINGGHNKTTVNEFYGACQNFKRQEAFVFEKDEPPALLGEDNGANPVEYVFAVLDGCLITSLIYHAAAKGIKIDEVETSISGDINLQGFLGLDQKIRNGYEKIKVEFKIKADAPKEKLQELVQLAQNRSPVFDIVSHPTPVEVSLGESNSKLN
ncbi:MAG TPA: OsmC family protein [Nitrososphaeraceae archaeon]|nr:OsmC family protein [Nitrososphaeraceae archaeon]